MDFNKFTKADGIRVVVMFFVIAVVYFSLGSNLWSEIKQLAFQLPIEPSTVTPTATPVPTRIPSPTSTPAPTSTFTPTPIPTSAFLPGEVVSFWNEFDNTDLLRGDWEFSPNVRVKDSMLVIEHSDDWSGVYGNAHLDNGQTVLIKFRFDMWSEIHMAVETGEFETDSYRSWGVGAENNIFSPVYTEGTLEYGGSFTSDELKLDPAKWYVLMLHIGGNKSFIARIWEYGNADNSFNFEVQLDETWQRQKWLPLFLVGPAGRLEIDRYEELKAYSGQ
jgi:hypothetical protein